MYLYMSELPFGILGSLTLCAHAGQTTGCLLYVVLMMAEGAEVHDRAMQQIWYR